MPWWNDNWLKEGEHFITNTKGLIPKCGLPQSYFKFIQDLQRTWNPSELTRSLNILFS